MKTTIIAVLSVIFLYSVVMSVETRIRKVYENGVVSLKIGDKENAIKYLSRASRFGSIQARELLAAHYAKGTILDRDREMALHYYSGVPRRLKERSLRYVVHSLREGLYGPPDEEEAEFWEEQIR